MRKNVRQRSEEAKPPQLGLGLGLEDDASFPQPSPTTDGGGNSHTTSDLNPNLTPNPNPGNEGGGSTDNESVDLSVLHPAKRSRLLRDELPTKTLPMEYWEREEACKVAKTEHLHYIDDIMASREEFILLTSLWKEDPVLEPNMFPYMCPEGVEHWTLWSVNEMDEEQISNFVQNWIMLNMPQVKRWNYDDNLGERSISLFHVHVYLETVPYSFNPNPNPSPPATAEPPQTQTLDPSSADPSHTNTHTYPYPYPYPHPSELEPAQS